MKLVKFTVLNNFLLYYIKYCDVWYKILMGKILTNLMNFPPATFVCEADPIHPSLNFPLSQFVPYGTVLYIYDNCYSVLVFL